ncbi:hypothetical protein MML48_3g00009509 [Holotrichia oblita]|uniref:Uncharacterized protein n=1 Tax=Holotrichia oblita TaxID=644536 RepID=A0ACB9TFR0_HOLOL|nr:hypothetical protein MML48_3g00009509 [Holotrichia oblita]
MPATTIETRAKIVSLWERGLSYRQVAAEVGVSLITEQLKQLQAQVTNLTGNVAYPDSNGGTSQGNTNYNIPWPNLLQIDSGDLWENIQLFKANWNTYTLATGMDKWSTNRESQKVNILLSIIGDAAKLKFNNFGLTDEDKVNCEKLLNKISDKILSKKHQLYERWLFHTCSQLTDESFQSYLLRLNKILDQCEFDKISVDNMKNVMLRDKIMFGINDQELNNKEERREEKKEERREEHKDERRGSEVKCNNKTNNELFSQKAIENKDPVRNTETVSKNDAKANNTGRSKTIKSQETVRTRFKKCSLPKLEDNIINCNLTDEFMPHKNRPVLTLLPGNLERIWFSYCWYTDYFQKPKKDGQKSQETEKYIRKKIDPCELAVGIETIKAIGKGSVVINCSDNDSKEKLRENVEKAIGNKYEIIDPKLKHPRIIVTGVEKDIVDESNDKILEAIITQNELINIDESIQTKIKVERKYLDNKKQNYGNIILCIHPELYTNITEKTKLNVGWKKYNIYEYIKLLFHVTDAHDTVTSKPVNVTLIQ